MTEFIGSRISLISKRDIRYVGILHEISSENSTVALERVVSYGTEGRRPDDEVPPSLDNVYEYIVFRGSDVKDLRIEEGPKENAAPNPPDDPAIVGNTRKPTAGQPPSQSSQVPPPQPSQPPSGGPPHQPLHQQHGPPGGFPPQGMPYGFNPNQRFGGPPGFPPGPYPFPPGPYGAPPGWFPPHGFPQMLPGQFPPGPMPIGAPGQRGPMPPPGQALGIPTPSGSAAPPEDRQQFSNPDEKPAAGPKAPGSSNAPIPLQEAPSGPSPGGAKAPAKADAGPAAAKAPTGPKSNRIVPAVPLPKAGAPANGDAAVGKPGADPNRDARAAVAAAMAKLPAAGGPKPDDGVDNLTQKVSEMRTADHHARRGGYNTNPRGGPRGRGRGGYGQQGPKVEIPTTDYDFDAANAKFNKHDLVKEAIASGSPLGTPDDDQPHPSTTFSTSSTASDANGGSGGRKGSDASAATPVTYNKSTSFFDDISSEIKDRAVHDETGTRPGGREFRHEERQKNMETFGQGSVDNGYRYRGRGRGRGGRGFRGRGPRGGGGRGRGAPAMDA